MCVCVYLKIVLDEQEKQLQSQKTFQEHSLKHSAAALPCEYLREGEEQPRRRFEPRQSSPRSRQDFRFRRGPGAVRGRRSLARSPARPPGASCRADRRRCDGQANKKQPRQGRGGGGVREKTYIVAISHQEISQQLHSLIKLTLNRPGDSRGGASGDPLRR